MKKFFFLGLPSLLILTACVTGTQDPAPVVIYGSSSGAGSAGIHTVSGGENLWRISKRYNISMRDIAEENDLRAPFALNDGQRLRLPAPLNYTVRHGDSLYTVSRIFNVSTSEVARLNDLSAPYTIQPGQSLRLPSHSRRAPPTEIIRAASMDKPVVSETLPASSPGSSSASGGHLDDVLSRTISKSGSQTASKAKAPSPAQVARSGASSSGSSSSFLSPVRGRLVSSFGPKDGGLHNDGINIAAPRGTPVKAARGGEVVYSGNAIRGSGNLVLVRHDNGLMSAYAHLDTITVKRGQTLSQGQKLGTVGSTGAVSSPQLHFEIRKGKTALDPKKYIKV